MSNDKITRFPIKAWERERNRRGKGSVSCAVSSRWLRMSKQDAKQGFGTPVWVDVITDAGDGEKKLCTLCLTVEELEAALQFVKS